MIEDVNAVLPAERRLVAKIDLQTLKLIVITAAFFFFYKPRTIHFSTQSSLTLTDLHVDAKSRGVSRTLSHASRLSVHISRLQVRTNQFVFVYG